MSYVQRCFVAVQCTAYICARTFTKLQTLHSIWDSRVLVIAFILIFFYHIFYWVLSQNIFYKERV